MKLISESNLKITLDISEHTPFKLCFLNNSSNQTFFSEKDIINVKSLFQILLRAFLFNYIFL